MTDQIEQWRKDGPTERQVRDWFQLSTINHHIQEDGSHISARAMYIAQSAWDAAKQSTPVVNIPALQAEAVELFCDILLGEVLKSDRPNMRVDEARLIWDERYLSAGVVAGVKYED